MFTSERRDTWAKVSIEDRRSIIKQYRSQVKQISGETEHQPLEKGKQIQICPVKV